jgi:TonB family protein
MVNFYWDQNLDNLPTSVRLSKSEYLTVVGVVLSADGAIEDIEVTGASGSDPIDLCVVNAFKIAQPFPNPPAQLVGKDGLVRIDTMGFVVEVGRAQMQYQGIDPRAGVQFPGIMRAPR